MKGAQACTRIMLRQVRGVAMHGMRAGRGVDGQGFLTDAIGILAKYSWCILHWHSCNNMQSAQTHESSCVSMATPRLTQCDSGCEVFSLIGITKFVLWPVVDKVPFLVDTLYMGQS